MGLKSGFIFSPVYLQQLSAEATAIVKSLFTLMLTANWSWRGNVLNLLNIVVQRGVGEKNTDNWSLW